MGYITTIKSFAILSDIFIGLILFSVAQAHKKANALLIAALFLFSPFSIYISSLWGQYDQLGFLFVLLAFVTFEKYFLVSPLLFALSVSLKPTSIILAPLYLWLLYKKRPSLKLLIIATLIAVVPVLLSVKAFADGNVINYTLGPIKRAVLDKAEMRVSTNSYNFWHILIGRDAFAQSKKFLFIPAYLWGIGAFSYINYKAFRHTSKFTKQKLFEALFLVAGGSWFFMTNMLERYLFAGIVFGLFTVIYNPKLLKYWLVLSVVFLANLYRGWWFPNDLPIKPLFDTEFDLLGRILSVVNLAIYIVMARTILKRD